jgi:hypothetical protein
MEKGSRISIESSKGQVFKQRIKYLILFFIVGITISGITAFPIVSELAIASNIMKQLQLSNGLSGWLEYVFQGVSETDSRYPFIAYGTDWLAFAHLVIAVAFIGPLRDPVRNIWVIEFGLIACAGIFPLALIAGYIREIPFFWRLIDCSFGLVGGVVLLVCYRMIRQLEKLKAPVHVQI